MPAGWLHAGMCKIPLSRFPYDDVSMLTFSPKIQNRRSKRTAKSRGKLRRHNNVESVMVEETFSLSLPKTTPESLRNEIGGEHAGDGCYVSATVHNKRYYGVLIEQAALKAASLLHFQSEASSLDLNRRMKMLKDQKDRGASEPSEKDAVASEQETGERKRTLENSAEESAKRPRVDVPLKASDTAFEAEESAKRPEVDAPLEASGPAFAAEESAERPKLDTPLEASDTAFAEEESAERPKVGTPLEASDTAFAEEESPKLPEVDATLEAGDTAPMIPQTIQKFRYVEPQQSAVGPNVGYRILLATYASVDAASEDDAEKGKRIELACKTGGGFVGNHYYQNEV